MPEVIRSGAVRLLINIAFFQAGWLICVIVSNEVAALAGFALVGAHLVLVSQRPAHEALFIGLGTLLGSLMDGLWFWLGFLVSPEPYSGLIPVWLVALWALFLTTPGHSLAWLAAHRRLVFLLSPVAGAFAYWSASQLGAVELRAPLLGLLAIGMGWLLLFPLLLSWSQHLLREPAAS